MSYYQHVIDQLVFKMSIKSVLEVEGDEEMIFAKEVLQRHPYPGRC